MTTIAIAGAAGAVGRRLREYLSCSAFAGVVVRPGARNVLAAGEGAVAFDLDDPTTFGPLLSGVRVVVNCTGAPEPARRHLVTAAGDAGVDYVDAGGDASAFAAFGDGIRAQRCIVGAGAVPGLPELLAEVGRPSRGAGGPRRAHRHPRSDHGG